MSQLFYIDWDRGRITKELLHSILVDYFDRINYPIGLLDVEEVGSKDDGEDGRDRVFIVAEASPSDPWTETHMSDYITESELKRRLALIAPMDLTYDDGCNAVGDEDINVLLHGDGNGYN